MKSYTTVKYHCPLQEFHIRWVRDFFHDYDIFHVVLEPSVLHDREEGILQQAKGTPCTRRPIRGVGFSPQP